MRPRTLPLVLLLAAFVALLAAPGAGASNDPGFPQQWNMVQVGAPAAWARSTGRGVKVGIVDTGVDAGHVDLAGKIGPGDSVTCLNGSCSGNGQDIDGHGTHVSGIATAIKDNGQGVAGVAPDAQLVVAGVFQCCDPQGHPFAYLDDINMGIHWVVDHGARVVNLSLGDSTPILPGLLGGSSGLTDGVEYAWNHGAVAVLAAGNTNYFGLGSENYGSVDALVVGATGPEGQVTGYSSPLGNAKWGLVAPGGDDQIQPDCSDLEQRGRCVLSTWRGNQYAWAQGTSMATPHVTGAVALLMAQNPNAPVSAAVQRILDTSDKVSCGNGCKGRLDVSAAVGLAPVAQPGGVSPSGSGAPGGPTGAPRSTRAPSTRAPASATTAPPANATTAPPGTAAAATGPGSGPPLVALPASPKGSISGKASDKPGRALAVAGAIVLLGGAGTGAGLAVRWLRGAAAR